MTRHYTKCNVRCDTFARSLLRLQHELLSKSELHLPGVLQQRGGHCDRHRSYPVGRSCRNSRHLVPIIGENGGRRARDRGSLDTSGANAFSENCHHRMADLDAGEAEQCATILNFRWEGRYRLTVFSFCETLTLISMGAGEVLLGYDGRKL